MKKTYVGSAHLESEFTPTRALIFTNFISQISLWIIWYTEIEDHRHLCSQDWLVGEEPFGEAYRPVYVIRDSVYIANDIHVRATWIASVTWCNLMRSCCVVMWSMRVTTQGRRDVTCRAEHEHDGNDVYVYLVPAIHRYTYRSVGAAVFRHFGACKRLDERPTEEKWRNHRCSCVGQCGMMFCAQDETLACLLRVTTMR